MCVLERSTIADSKCSRILVPEEQAFRPTTYTADFAIDGTEANWGDLSCGIPMWEAGNPNPPNGNPILASHAFLNWDCSTSELCILVKAVDGYTLRDQFWFKDYSLGQSDQVPIVGKEVQTILNSTTNEIIAWEACYSMAADCSDAVEIHANFGDIGGSGGRTSSTGKTSTFGEIALDLTCPCEEKGDCVINACYEPSTCVEVDGIDSNTTLICEYSVPSDNCCAGDADCDSDSLECKGVGVSDDESSTAGTCQLRETTTTTSTTKAPVTGDGGGSASTTIAPIIDECTSDDTSESECNLDKLSPAQGSKDCAAPICNLDLEKTSGNTCGITQAYQGESCDMNDNKDEDNTCYIGNVCSGSGFNCIAAYMGEDHDCDGPENDPYGCNFECVDYKCLADPEDSSSTRTTCEAVPKSKGTACNREGFPRGKYSRLHHKHFHTLFCHMPYLILHYFIHFITQANATAETSAMERECVPRHIHTCLVTPLVVAV